MQPEAVVALSMMAFTSTHWAWFDLAVWLSRHVRARFATTLLSDVQELQEEGDSRRRLMLQLRVETKRLLYRALLYVSFQLRMVLWQRGEG